MNKFIKYGCLCLSLPPLLLIGLLLLLSSYLYFTSGTFKDPDTCWDKAFYSEVPENVKIINAQYWTSAHWSHEYIYYFKFKYDEEFLNSLTGKLISKLPKDFRHYVYHDAPDWFPRPSKDEYHIWITGERFSRFMLFYDKEKEYLYMMDSQL